MKKNTTNKKICVISLTYNRPFYIERSFDSLYKRAGYDFDHYVFDDCSDKETTQLLRNLQKKYHFTLMRNDTRLGIFKNFHMNVRVIPEIYDFYMKFDSDVEVLSDDFLSSILDVVDMPAGLSVLTPRVEGMFNQQSFDDHTDRVEYYNSHALRIGIPIKYGCCLIFPREIFESFPKMTNNQLLTSTEQYAIDASLCKHSMQFGRSALIEDLSVYHIDNSYGQRRRDMTYFLNRNRWENADTTEVWFLKVSKDIYPRHIKRGMLDIIKNTSLDSYDAFLKACNDALTYGIDEDRDNWEVRHILQNVKQKEILKIVVYKITAPDNFVNSVNVPKNSITYFKVRPIWSSTDPGIVVEKVLMSIEDAKKVIVD